MVIVIVGTKDPPGILRGHYPGQERNETGEQQQWQRLLVQVQIAIPFKFWGSLHYKTYKTLPAGNSVMCPLFLGVTKNKNTSYGR